MTNRREFVQSLILGSAGALFTPQLLAARSPFLTLDRTLPANTSADDPWSEAAKILARIKPPVFPNRDFKITDHGAVADGSKDSTSAIRKAIDICHAAGGGRVVATPGVFVTRAIHLKSNVNLYLAEGATLKFSTDPAQYLPVVHTRFEGTECMNYSPFIYAFEQENIAITGSGVLDGSASNDNWWKWARRAADDTDSPARPDIRRLLNFGERGVPVAERIFGQNHLLRPNFIQPYRLSRC